MSVPSRSAHELVATIHEREAVALAALGAASGNESLCALSRGRTPVPAIKYHEGAAAAMADGRRAVQVVPEGLNAESVMRLALADVHERWSAQARSPGRTGPNWAGYLAGGLDALDQLIEGVGSAARDGQG